MEECQTVLQKDAPTNKRTRAEGSEGYVVLMEDIPFARFQDAVRRSTTPEVVLEVFVAGTGVYPNVKSLGAKSNSAT